VWRALVQPEQFGLVRVAIVDLDDDVVEYRQQLVRQLVERIGDQLLEPVARDDLQLRSPSAED
jgi:hypothetical protein